MAVEHGLQKDLRPKTAMEHGLQELSFCKPHRMDSRGPGRAEFCENRFELRIFITHTRRLF